MTARHKKPKELTPTQKRLLRAGTLAPLSAGFVLVAATGAFADPQAQTQSQGLTRATLQAHLVPDSTVVARHREWHGRQGDWQGDFQLDDQRRWQGQWTPDDGQNQHGQQNRNAHQNRNGRQNRHIQQGKRHAPRTSVVVKRILQLVNKERAAAGLRSLALNSRLSAAAQAHSDEMARTGLYAHTDPDGSSPGDRIQRAGYGWSMWAENIHHRQGSPEDIMADWMKSPGHRANILNPNLREIGIGVDADGTYWTQDFGTGR